MLYGNFLEIKEVVNSTYLIATVEYGYGYNLLPTGFIKGILPSTTADEDEITYTFTSDAAPVVERAYDDGKGTLYIEGYRFNSIDISEYSV